MRIVILGAPGSGKRTQTALVAEKYGLPSVMTGDLVKNAVLERTPLGIEIKELQDTGRVVTEDIVLALLREQLLKPELREGFILDGFPRNLLQALTLDELMVEIEQPLDLILLIDIETDTLMERLVGRRTCRSCGLLYNIYRNPPVVDGVCDVCGGRLHLRSDDNEETVSSRFHVFDHLISPLITHYEKQGRLVRIDGNGEINQVFQLVCAAIDGESQAETPVEPRPQTDAPEPVEERGESLLEQAANQRSGEEGAASAPNKPAQKNNTVTKQAVEKKASGKKAAKKSPNTRPASSSTAVKKKSVKKKTNKKKAIKDRVVSKKKLTTKKKTTERPPKSKANRKTGSPGKSSGKSEKSGRTSPRKSANSVRKSPNKKAKKGVSVKGMVKK